MSTPHRRRDLLAAGGSWALLPAVLLLGCLGCASAAAQRRDSSRPVFREPLHLVVNIPAYRLDVYEHGTLVSSPRVTVGKRREPTPVGSYRLRKVVWNPWWHPPYNRRPKDKVTPPGPRNPMGKVKIYFADLYYLHGTPKEQELGTPASRGCVRMSNQDAIALATLVHRHGSPLPADKLDALVSTRSWRTREYPVSANLPLDLVYQLAEVRDGQLLVYPDLYRRARAPLTELAARALVAAGYPRERVDLPALARAIGEGGQAVRLAVDDVLRS